MSLPSLQKTRYEHVEFLSKCTKKITKRYAFFINKLSEFAPVTRIAEAVQIPTTSLWRHDLEILEAKFKKYGIPSLSHICVDEVYAKSWHDKDNDENRDDRFFTIISDLISRKVVWVEYSRRKAALDQCPVRAPLTQNRQLFKIGSSAARHGCFLAQ